jgi:hypothetical protein
MSYPCASARGRMALVRTAVSENISPLSSGFLRAIGPHSCVTVASLFISLPTEGYYVGSKNAIFTVSLKMTDCSLINSNFFLKTTCTWKIQFSFNIPLPAFMKSVLPLKLQLFYASLVRIGFTFAPFTWVSRPLLIIFLHQRRLFLNIGHSALTMEADISFET